MPGTTLPGVLSLALLPAQAAAAAETPSGEYAVKAVFLMNFTRFVEWPAEAFRDERSPLVIGVLGEDPFGKLLDAATDRKKADQRKIEVLRFKTLAELQPCHVLFISDSEKERRTEIQKSLSDKPVLTVSEISDFSEKEGMIQFVMVENKVRLWINVENAKGAKLKIKSNLLRIARVLPERKPKGEE
ncbi:MAG: YfiR family protein [Thermoanaerobaculia bacterium]